MHPCSITCKFQEKPGKTDNVQKSVLGLMMTGYIFRGRNSYYFLPCLPSEGAWPRSAIGRAPDS